MRQMTHDRQCAMLAEHFLRDYILTRSEHEERLNRLAVVIQRAVEDELASLSDKLRS